MKNVIRKVAAAFCMLFVVGCAGFNRGRIIDTVGEIVEEIDNDSSSTEPIDEVKEDDDEKNPA